MPLNTIDARTLMGLLLNSLECYCNLLRKGIYTGQSFNDCRTELHEIRIALKEALRRRTSPFFRQVPQKISPLFFQKQDRQ
jgi:hypothetical protein